MEKSKLLYINIDGFSYSYFEQLMDKEPGGPFAKLRDEGMLYTDLHSGLVSITNPMQSAILCGAWSNRTRNFYQHYDWQRGEIVKHARTFDAENIAQVFAQSGKTVVSIHQFMLENRPCREGNKECAYIKCPQVKSNSFHRIAVLKDLICGKPVISGNEQFVYEEFPEFVALYMDDIDSLGHNNTYEHYAKRGDFQERQKDIQERLSLMGSELLEVIDLCKTTGIYGDMNILITTDHGMTPFFGKSMLEDTMARLRQVGIQTDLPENRTAGTRVVALPYTIELSLYGAPDLTLEEKIRIHSVCQQIPYVDRVFHKEEMLSSFGMDERGPDFILSPQYGSHFYHRDIPEETFGASHDSFDSTSQHIFGLLLGKDVRKQSYFEEKVSAIDLLPTILDKQFGMKMKDQTGKVWDGWFSK